MEALSQHLNKCEACRINSFIIELEELPEYQKQRFEAYDINKRFILYCRPCEVYMMLPEPIDKNFL